MKIRYLATIALLLISLPAFGQQVGSISGTVTSEDGDPLPGVTVEATGDVLPRARVFVANALGQYRLPQLPVGQYKLTFTLEGLASVTREVKVLLGQNTIVNIEMRPEAVVEQVEVVAEIPVIDPSSAEIKAAIDSDVIEMLPVGQEYRDLVKLIPGVQ